VLFRKDGFIIMLFGNNEGCDPNSRDELTRILPRVNTTGRWEVSSNGGSLLLLTILGINSLWSPLEYLLLEIDSLWPRAEDKTSDSFVFLAALELPLLFVGNRCLVKFSKTIEIRIKRDYYCQKRERKKVEIQFKRSYLQKWREQKRLLWSCTIAGRC